MFHTLIHVHTFHSCLVMLWVPLFQPPTAEITILRKRELGAKDLDHVIYSL